MKVQAYGIGNFMFQGDGCNSSFVGIYAKAESGTAIVIGRRVAYRQVCDFIVQSLEIIKNTVFLLSYEP